jgi:MFS family permease
MGFFIPIIARFNMFASGIEVSLIMSASVFGRTISGLISGFITDRTKSKTRLVLIGSFGRAIAYFIMYYAIYINSILLLGLGNFALGFMAGIFWVPVNTLIAQKSNIENRSHAYGKRNAFNAIGQILGSLIGFNLFFILSIFTNNTLITYNCIILFGIANIYAGIKFYREIDETIIFSESSEKITYVHPSNNNKTTLKPIIIIGSVFLMLILFFGSINSSIARPFLNIYIIENIEGDLLLATYAYLPAGLIATFFAPKLGEYVDKLHPVIGITITSLSGALITWFLINSANILIFSILLLFDMSIAIAAGLIFEGILSKISKEHRGKVFGFGDFFTFLGSVIGPILGGVVWDYVSHQFPFIISIFVELSLIPLYLIIIYFLIPHLTEKKEK